MLESYYSLGVLLPILISIVFAIIIYLFTKHYFCKDTAQDHKFDPDLFKIPINFSIQVLGIVVPILSIFTSYLVTKNSDLQIDFLLAAIALYFLVIIVATWQAFSIARARVEDNTGKLLLNWEKDSAQISANAILYELIAAGFICLVLFFLLELNPKELAKTSVNAPESVSIMRQPLDIGMSNDDVIDLWGNPSEYQNKSNTWVYFGPNTTIFIEFDDDKTLRKITTELRKSK
jgi:hypothetical protein